MGVGAGTHTLLCVYVGVIVYPRVCVYCVAGVCWEEVWVGGRREGSCDMQAGVWEGRRRCGWWGEGGCCAVCVRCEWMRGSRKGVRGSGERQVVAKCVGGMMGVIDGSWWAQATQCVFV